MAEASSATSGQTLDCPICLEQYQRPRYLPCLHSFCEDCLNSYIQSYKGTSEDCLNSYVQSHKGTSTDFPCPVCRSPVPDLISSTESPAQNFPINDLMVTMMDGGMKRKDDITCTMCRDIRDSSVAAVYWCTDCSEGLCEKCYNYHQKNKTNSDHNSGLIGTSTHIQVNSNNSIDEDCPQHRGKVLEVYCSDHSELCCVVCFATKHRECKQIHPIDELSEGFDIDDACLKFSAETTEIEQKLVTLASVKNTKISNVDEEAKFVTTKITDSVNKAKTKLDNVCDTLINDVKQKYETEKQKLQRQHKQIQSFEKDVQNCRKVMTSVSAGTRRQVFITFQKIKSQLFSHFSQLKSELANDVNINVRFYTGNLFVSLDSQNIFGKVETKRFHARKTADTMAQVDNHFDKLAHNLNLASYINAMDDEVKLVKVITDKDLSYGVINEFCGGTFLPDGRFLIAEDSDENRLVLFDETFAVITTISVDGRPNHVTMGAGDTDILVCMKNGDVVTYTLCDEGKLSKKFKFTIFPPAWSLVAFDKILIAGGDDIVSTFSMKGYRIDDCTVHGKVVVVAKHDTNQTYYYTDGNSVVCKRLAGEQVFRHDAGTLVFGTAVDRQGNVYVGYLNENGNKAGSIYQISSDGRRSRFVVHALHSITEVYSIIFHKTKPLFVVVPNGPNSVLEVYEFVR
ncbi:E3 ubiquitin-protein ligase TRIM33-like [Argopecten irradians]|uniref:E3 ubiquitin-protein ligase TRIM33-like n=1 Tax=Argopecten irradians TaxID=31199 RepID=UPI003711A9AE